MKQLVLLFLCLISMQFIGFTQEVAPAIVIETSGTITSKTDKGAVFNVEAGSALANDAKLTLMAKANLLVLQNDKFVRVKKAGVLDLASNSDSDMENSALNFDPLFAEFIKASMAITFDKAHEGIWKIRYVNKRGDGWGATDPKNTGGWGVGDPRNTGGWGVGDPRNTGGWGVGDPRNTGGWGVTEPKQTGGWGVGDPRNTGGWGVTDPRNTGGWGVGDPRNTGGWGVTDPKHTGGWGVGDPRNTGGWGVTDPKQTGGWTKEDMTIQVASPGGIYRAAEVKLSWVTQKDVTKYLFCIVDENLNMIYSQVVVGSSINIDLSKLDGAKTYYWQVFAGKKKAISPAVTFTLATKDQLKEVEAMYKDSDIYNKAAKSVQGMMEAVAYEVSKMYLDTYSKYEALVLANPSNDLVKIAYAGFCMRMGQDLKAKKLVEQI